MSVYRGLVERVRVGQLGRFQVRDETDPEGDNIHLGPAGGGTGEERVAAAAAEAEEGIGGVTGGAGWKEVSEWRPQHEAGGDIVAGSQQNTTSQRYWCEGGVTQMIVTSVEACCEWWGRQVGQHTTPTILVSLCLVGLASLGLFNLTLEMRPYRLWIPQDSYFTQVNDWRMKNFPSNYRYQVLLWEANENLLTGRTVRSMWRLHQQIVNLTLNVGDSVVTWDHVCTRVPSLISDTIHSRTVRDAPFEPLPAKNHKWKEDYEAQKGSSFAPTGDAKQALGNTSQAPRNTNQTTGDTSQATWETSPAPADTSQATGETSPAPAVTSQTPGATSPATWNSSKAPGDTNQALGNFSKSPLDSSPAPGDNLQALGDTSSAPGDNLQALGNTSLASGDNLQALGDTNLAPGYNLQYQGDSPTQWDSSPAPGNTNQTNENTSQVLRNPNPVPQDSYQATGDTSQNPGEASQAPGKASQVPGLASQAPGDASQAPGDASQAPGDASQAPGDASQAPGDASQAPENASQVQGKSSSEWPLKQASQEERELMGRVSREVWEAARTDYSHLLPRGIYCSVLDSLPSLCYERSVLEVWGYHQHLIMNLTNDEVLHDVNEMTTSNVYGYPLQVTDFLGGVVRDDSGHIVAARSALHTWVTKVNTNTTSSEVDLGTGQLVDRDGMAWEVALLHQAQQAHIPSDVTLYVHAAHSFGKVSATAIMDDVIWVIVGWVAMVLYVVATLGRPLPALVGLLCVALAVAASYGICSAFGVPYGPIASVLPVLLVGLGVDDMYVVMGAWEAVGGQGITVAEQSKQTLRKAGVAITLTSLTDVVAFLVGSSTQVPALKWFCIYAASGIAAVYFLQVTIFVAALAIDQHTRASATTKCSIEPPCKQSSRGVVGWAMKRYAKVVVMPAVAAVVVVVAAAMLGAGVWGAVSLRQQFNPVWFLPHSSYLYHWFTAMDRCFPKVGERGSVYFANVSLPEELPALNALADSLRKSSYIVKVDSWFSELDIYMYHDYRYSGRELTEELLHEALGIFLQSKIGARFTPHFIFDEPLECHDPAPPFSVFKLEFVYRRLDERWQQQAAMAEVRRVVESSNVSGYHAAWAHVYSQWETDASLATELWRNLGLVVSVVAVVTMVVVGAGLAALLVVGCVVATLVEVAALMYLWGLTVDTVTTIALVLAVGLCVDYAAHIAHAFLEGKGSRQARAQAAVATVGPAVLHAGLSTLLAFLALAPSKSHLFIAFFKIFTSMSVLGLFQGLVVLPALLSLVGSDPRTLKHSQSKLAPAPEQPVPEPPAPEPPAPSQYTHIHHTHNHAHFPLLPQP